MENNLQEAISILTSELAKDKSGGSYYYGWQANIAMAFKDEWERQSERKSPLDKMDIHETANNAAKYFLDLLISISNT